MTKCSNCGKEKSEETNAKKFDDLSIQLEQAFESRDGWIKVDGQKKHLTQIMKEMKETLRKMPLDPNRHKKIKGD